MIEFRDPTHGLLGLFKKQNNSNRSNDQGWNGDNLSEKRHCVYIEKNHRISKWGSENSISLPGKI